MVISYLSDRYKLIILLEKKSFEIIEDKDNLLNLSEAIVRCEKEAGIHIMRRDNGYNIIRYLRQKIHQGHLKSKQKRFADDDEKNNMPEIRQLMDLFDKYKTFPTKTVNDELAKEIDSFLTPENIKKINSPEDYINGDLLKGAHVKLLELFYAISSVTGYFDTRDKIFNHLYTIYELDPHSIDSLHIQNAYIRHLNSIGLALSKEDEIISRKLFNVIEYSLNANFKKISKIKTASEAKENESLITSMQEMIWVIIINGDRNRKTGGNEISYTRTMLKNVVVEEKYGSFAAQLFSNEYLKIRKSVSRKITDDFVNNDEGTKLRNFIASSKNLWDVLNYMTEHSIPYELGCYYMLTEEDPTEVYEVFQSSDIVVDVRFRLYALKILSKMKPGEDDVIFHIKSYNESPSSLIRILTSFDPKAGGEEFDKLIKLKEECSGEFLITKEQRRELAEVADTFIKSETYTERKNPFSNNIDAELLITALILRSSNTDDVDIMKSLKKMPEVFSFNTISSGKLHEVVSDDDNQESLLFQDVASNGKSSEKEKLLRFFDMDLPSILVS